MNPFTGILAYEGVQTTDGRTIEADAVILASGPPTMPLPLMHQPQDGEAGNLCGRVDRVWRDGQELHAEGLADLPPGDYPVAVELGSMTYGALDPALVISEARLLGVMLAASPAWPGAVITVTEAS